MNVIKVAISFSRWFENFPIWEIDRISGPVSVHTNAPLAWEQASARESRWLHIKPRVYFIRLIIASHSDERNNATNKSSNRTTREFTWKFLLANQHRLQSGPMRTNRAVHSYYPCSSQAPARWIGWTMSSKDALFIRHEYKLWLLTLVLCGWVAGVRTKQW